MAETTVEVREWLVAHKGEPLTPEVAAAILCAGGSPSSISSRTFEFTNDAIDWIETIANE